eukprot:COSAG02_NODE_1222_length_13800_cov_66.755565_10_plen_616_part_00
MGSKRADQEYALETHPLAKWGLLIVNFLIAGFGVAVLALVGMMISEESATSAAITPLIVLGCSFLIIGCLGMWASYASGDVERAYTRKILGAYWLCLFFGTVLAVWMLAYATVNFPKIEDKVMRHFEENWRELVVSLPEEVLDKVPRSCGGNKVNQCDFSILGADEPGFADPSDPTEDEIDACTAVTSEAEEGEDQVICVYEAPCPMPPMCAGEYDSDADGEADTECPDMTPKCVNTNGEPCEETDEFWCDPVQANCAAGCTIVEPANEEDDCPTDRGCDYFPAEEGEALCVEETVESTAEDGRRLQDDTEEPEPEPFMLGSPEDFEAQCWNTIKESMMLKQRTLGVCLLIVVILQISCMFWCIVLLTPHTAINSVRQAIDAGMTVAGFLIFATGLIMARELNFEETSGLSLPLIVLGLFMVCLGILFGCYSQKYANCAKYATAVYAFLFIVMGAMAIVCIAYEDSVSEQVAEKGDDWLGKFCDTDCYADIQGRLNGTRGADTACSTPPDGDDECYAQYNWAGNKHLDIACNSTAPNTVSQLCECPCKVAKAVAHVKEATEEIIISKIMSSVNTMGWLCILISIYLLIEVFAHLYIHNSHWDGFEHDEATMERGI